MSLKFEIAELKRMRLSAHAETGVDEATQQDLLRVLDRAEDTWNQRNADQHRQTVVEKNLTLPELYEAAGLEETVPESGEPELYARRRAFIESLKGEEG